MRRESGASKISAAGGRPRSAWGEWFNIQCCKAIREYGESPKWVPILWWNRLLDVHLFYPQMAGVTCGSIRIVDGTIGQDADRYIDWVRKALALIESTDVRIWNLVTREIKYVAISYQTSAGTYRRSTRCCKIDFEKAFPGVAELPGEHEEWYVARLARLIVHEAMHGRFYDFGIPYTAATRERVERLCERQAARFVRRLPRERYDFSRLAIPFDAERWQPYWDSRHRRRLEKEMWRRVWRQITELRKPT